MNNSKLSSLTIFFPFYNDAGTVQSLLDEAYAVGLKVCNDLEVIAIHGGASKDSTQEEIQKAKQKYPALVIIDRTNNKESYAVIKHGFWNATKEWVFYTDGDAQYQLSDLPALVAKQLETGADVVNGYKKRRHDSFMRVVAGYTYQWLSKLVFALPIRDLDCDFRLIRNSCLQNINLMAQDASILTELIKKLEISGATFYEVPVTHFSRRYGQSNYSLLRLIKEKIVGDFKLFWELRKYT